MFAICLNTDNLNFSVVIDKILHVSNFINNDSESTSNPVGTCKLPEDGIDDAETCRSKSLRE
jgi:hypothetical protein